jgi:hypothetical protein
MSALQKVLLHAEQLEDALDPLILVGLAYLLVRGRRHLKGVRFGVLCLLGFVAAYVLVCAVMASHWVQERYYRPIIPFAAVLAAMGYWCLARDVRSRRALYAAGGIVLVLCLFFTLREPIRAHRRPQTQAGRWLRAHDPAYDGFVVSEYSQPVYYAGMKFFDGGQAGTEGLFRDLAARGVPFKYVIVEGEPEGDWPERYVAEHGWRLVYQEPERNLRIYTP